jgi:hypothetical protein
MRVNLSASLKQESQIKVGGWGLDVQTHLQPGV